MKIYKIEVIESLSRVVEIEAESVEEAAAKVESLYKNAVVTLDSSDYTDVKFVEYNDSEGASKHVRRNVKSLN